MATRELRSEFHLKLDTLDADLLQMGRLTQDQLDKAVQALVEGRLDLSREVITGDARLDDMETDLEIRCVQLLATEGPVASDLRLVSSIFKITADLERIGDHAVKIAHIGTDLKKMGHPGPLDEIAVFGQLVLGMLQDTCLAYEERNIALSRDVRIRDRVINLRCQQLDAGIVEKMESSPKDIDYYSLLHFVPGRLERVADHCRNIAERVEYIVTGQYLLHEHSAD